MRASLCLVFVLGCGDAATTQNPDLTQPSDVDMAKPATPDLLLPPGLDLAPIVTACVANAPCEVGEGSGLCKSGVPTACTDMTDDAACVTTYGSGYLCIDGACAQGNCRSSSDCSGRDCVNNQCALPCTVDSDCTAAGQVCNTSSGACVTNASCAAAGNGAACPVNAADCCCGTPGAAVCEDVDCCTNTDCGASQTCQSGRCVNNTCPSPAPMVRFVDSAQVTVTGNNGTKACPYKQLEPALHDLRTVGGTVAVKVGSTFNMAQPRKVEGNIHLTAADPTFAPCNLTACPDATVYPSINVTSTAPAVIFQGTATMSFFNVKRDVSITGPAPGVLVAPGATATMRHLKVTQFGRGVLVTKTGVAMVGEGVHLDNNGVGLGVDSGGTASVTIANGNMKATTFKNNLGHGATVVGNGKLNMSAPAAMVPLITADGNGLSGLHFYSSNATASVLDGVGLVNNKVHGIHVLAGSHLKLQNSKLTGNQKPAMAVAPNGAVTDTSQIDFVTGNDIPDYCYWDAMCL